MSYQEGKKLIFSGCTAKKKLLLDVVRMYMARYSLVFACNSKKLRSFAFFFSIALFVCITFHSRTTTMNECNFFFLSLYCLVLYMSCNLVPDKRCSTTDLCASTSCSAALSRDSFEKGSSDFATTSSSLSVAASCIIFSRCV
jgi:hypothetical protein